MSTGRKIKMNNICDIHCHILFDVDDGAKHFEQSVNMLEMAFEEGIRSIILTPHYNKAYSEEGKETLSRHFLRLKNYVEENLPGMMLYLGNEILYHDGVVGELKQGNANTMAGGRYVLLEFMPWEPFSYIRNAVTTVMQNEYVPIVAHVERCKCLLKEFDSVLILKEQGALIQVNAGSVMGKHGWKEKRFCRKLLNYGLVDFVATDAHRDDVRKPEIQACANWIAKKYGLEEAETIFTTNPQKIICNEEFTEE